MNGPVSISVLDEIPPTSSFTPLSEHQTQTPTTFFGSTPVLHVSFTGADLLISKHDASHWPAFTTVIGAAHQSASSATIDGDGANGSSTVTGQPSSEDDTVNNKSVHVGISGYITTHSVLLFHTDPNAAGATKKALEIPYPCISIHATQRIKTSLPHVYHEHGSSETLEQQAIFLQIDLGDPATRDPGADEDAGETVELLILPKLQAHPRVGTAAAAGQEAEEGPRTNPGQVKAVFEALSVCADLHPDPGVEGEEDGEGEGMGAMGMGGMPGEGGWITADNVEEFEARFGHMIGDEEGEDGEEDGEEEDGQEQQEPLGPGAGSRRAREDDASEAGEAVDGEHDDAKWQRTG